MSNTIDEGWKLVRDFEAMAEKAPDPDQHRRAKQIAGTIRALIEELEAATLLADARYRRSKITRVG